MTEYALTWDLDSLLPHPETDDFRKTVDEFATGLQSLAERSDELPPIATSAVRDISYLGLRTTTSSLGNQTLAKRVSIS